MADEAEIRARVEARHNEILGAAPRILPVDRQVAAEQVQAATRALRGGVVGKSDELPLDAIPEIMFTMCRFSGIWQRIMDLSIEIQGPASTLPARERKLAILRTGWLCQAPYEFGEHVIQSQRLGFTDTEIARIAEGSAAPEWVPHERAVLCAVEELVAHAMISDDTWTALAERLSEQQLFELIVIVGQFVATAYFQNSLRLRLEGANRGLKLPAFDGQPSGT